MIPALSATNPLQVALVDALRADMALQAILHTATGIPGDVADAFARVYDEGAVPAKLVGRWITVGDTGESWANAFMRGGSRIVVTLHVWHTPVEGEDVGKLTTLSVYTELARTLSGLLPLAGHSFLRGSAQLIGVGKDTDGQSWHAPVRYEARTQVGP